MVFLSLYALDLRSGPFSASPRKSQVVYAGTSGPRLCRTASMLSAKEEGALAALTIVLQVPAELLWNRDNRLESVCPHLAFRSNE